MQKRIYKLLTVIIAMVLFCSTNMFSLKSSIGIAEEIEADWTEEAAEGGKLWNNSENSAYVWSENVPEPENYDYSFVLVGDTQTLTMDYPAKFHHLYDYIVANAELKKIKHVFGLGDITNDDVDTQWSLAQYQIGKLDGVVSYSLTRGNHDGKAQLKKYFGGNLSPYAKQYSQVYNKDYTTTVHEFSAGALDYLVITLDYCPTNAMIEWAEDIITAHPNHNIIISTHSYLDKDGNHDTIIDKDPPVAKPGENCGKDIWDKLVSKYSNIVMVYCGHVCNTQDRVVLSQPEGENGNIVSEILVNPQATELKKPLGLVAMLYFSDSGRHVDVRYYSTIQQKWFMPENQFDFTVNTIAKA